MIALSADIVGHWKTRAVWINGKQITISGLLRDLKADEEVPGDNLDIIKEYKGVRRFSWGDDSNATNCLALACCFYLNLKWVMCRFFEKEFKQVAKADMQLHFADEQIKKGYQYSEDLFAQEFKAFKDEIGAKEIDENDTRN